MRRLAKRGQVRLWRCEAESDLARCLTLLFELHRKRWELRGRSGAFARAAKRRFYEDMSRQFLRRGWLDFWLLDVEGVTVAAEFGFRYGDTYSYLQGGFDPAYVSQGVGQALKAMILRELIRAGVRYHDFLGGEDAYKTRWGTERYMLLSLRCAHPGTFGAYYAGLVDVGTRGKAWLRTHTSGRTRALLRKAYRSVQAIRRFVGRLMIFA